VGGQCIGRGGGNIVKTLTFEKGGGGHAPPTHMVALPLTIRVKYFVKPFFAKL